MKPGSNQNSSNLGFEGGAMKLNYSFFFFPWRRGERERRRKEGGRERENAYDLAEVPGIEGSYLYRSFKEARRVNKTRNRRN